MIKNWIQKLENSPITFWQAIFLIYIAVLFRAFLEGYANPENLNHLGGIIDTFFHYPFWFFGVFLSVFILLRILTKENISKISKLGAIFSFAIIISPIFDLIAGKNLPHPYAFITGTLNEIIHCFLTFLGGSLGIGIGIRIEIFLGILFLGYYVFYKTKSLWRSFAGAFLLYMVVFSFCMFPTVLFEAQSIISGDAQKLTRRTVPTFYYIQEPANSITNYRIFVLDRNTFDSPKIQSIKNQYSITISICLLIIDVLILAWWTFLYSAKKIISILKNFRYLRFIHYYLMIALGIYLGVSFSGRNPVGSTFDLLSFVGLFFSFLFAFLFSIWENDAIDINIDKISNPNRPLAKGEFSMEEWRAIKYLFLFLSLAFAFLTGLYAFIFILMFIAAYHIYSAPPLRLKRFLGISSFLIAVNSLLAVFMGFFLSAGTEKLTVFPQKYILGILAIVFLGENVKNLKDTEGDKREGIKTLPVVLGEKTGKLIIGIFVFLATLLVPFIFFANIYAFFTAAFFGLILFFLVNRKNFEEKYIFITYFVFAAVFVSEILFLN